MRFSRSAVLGLAVFLVPFQNGSAVSAVTSVRSAGSSLELTSLRSIAGWLRQHGREGYVGADVADAMGIPRDKSEQVLEAKQQGFRNENVLRIAQISADDKRDFLLFMVQRPDDQVYFYLSTVRDGLKKAFLSVPSKNLVLPLDFAEAELRFQQEVLYWEDRIAAAQ